MRASKLTIFWLDYQYDPNVRHDMGGFRATLELAEALERRGHRILIFAPRPTKTREETRLQVVRFPLVDLPGIRPLLVYLLLLVVPLWYARRIRPDGLYFTFGLSPFSLLLARLLRCPLIFDVRGDSAHQARLRGDWVRAALTDGFYRWVLPKADLFAAISDELRRTLADRHGVPPERSRVIPCGTNLEHFTPRPPPVARARIGLEPDRPTAGFAGTFFDYQGVQTLIEAAPAILSRFPRVLFLLVGDGEMRRNWEAMVRAKKLGSSFRFTGQVPYRDVPLYMNAMDVTVAPMIASRGPVSPLKLFDYWGCGRPVVASDLPDLTPLLRESQGAIPVPPDDPHALAEAVSDLLADEAKRLALGAAGRRFVETHHSWDHVAERLEQLFFEAISNRSR